ncbi:MAG: molecular chaperone DnaJ [Bacteroidaceae bacterium]|nr:molecular chaperone DnaJ [Bacteroidaceae bacterium]
MKPEKIALCRECKGTGKLTGAGVQACCPNCCGSGRVYVSCEMKLHIRPYRD